MGYVIGEEQNGLSLGTDVGIGAGFLRVIFNLIPEPIPVSSCGHVVGHNIIGSGDPEIAGSLVSHQQCVDCHCHHG